jgi:hypothetical protein
MPPSGFTQRLSRAAAILLAAATLAHADGEWAPTGLWFQNDSKQDWTFTVSGGEREELGLGYRLDASDEGDEEDPVRLQRESQVTLAPGDLLELCRAGETAPEGTQATFHFQDAAQEMELDVILRVQDGTFELVQGKTLDLEGRFDEKAQVKEGGVTFPDAGSAVGAGIAPAEAAMAAGAGSTMTRSAGMGPLILALRLGIPDLADPLQAPESPATPKLQEP